MANTVDIQTIQDGARNAVFRVYIASDGSSGDEADTAIVDVSSLNNDPDGKSVDNVRVDRINAMLNGFDARLEFDADTDDEILVLKDGQEYDYDYRRSGGLVDPKSTGYTGDITITTSGLASTDDEGMIYLECTKRYG